jgi:predicted RNA-binding protein YlqC (UPF0109 family)
VVIKALRRFFGASPAEDVKKEPASAPQSSSSSSSASKTSLKDLEAFVGYVVKALVDNPDEVKIETVQDGDGKLVKISCRKEDVGKIVGKKGKTIIALRSLVGGAASRMQEKVSVEVVD